MSRKSFTLADDGVSIALPGREPVTVGLDFLSRCISRVEAKHSRPWKRVPLDEQTALMDAWTKAAAEDGKEPPVLPAADQPIIGFSAKFYADLAAELADAGIAGCTPSYAEQIREQAAEALDEAKKSTAPESASPIGSAGQPQPA